MDGPGSELLQFCSRGMFIDIHDDLYIADTCNHRVMKYPLYGWPSIVAGTTGINGSSSTLLNRPSKVSVDYNQNIYVGDAGNYRVQRFPRGSKEGTTVAGTGVPGFASNTMFWMNGMYLDAKQNLLYLADGNNQRVVVWRSTGGFNNSLYVITVRGSPEDVNVDEEGNVFVLDFFDTLFKYPPGSNVSTDISSDFQIPRAMKLDGRGNFLVAQQMNGVIKMFSLADANATGDIILSHLDDPVDIAFDSSYNLYVLESGRNWVKRFDKL
ncbi:unnamed protein product [Didymodactylos carnosus]|uniref:NHL repeat-containing protein n=1 Tax=Didymodactylos carnosus TaxID=1234261 RepID=A0A814IL13_9BILA|nr:unnamed protein product [Didymodactylos carnosus]CAF1584484.1 unnamed protein product [Didymodactylos carnosus]CAF3796179.1 unnamed protein product [Didymodactylos carnosus]CAF4385129.1 unnamed protein product [Didymodactylos carnosus]